MRIRDKNIAVLAFDIETTPDIEGWRTTFELSVNLSDDEVIEFAKRQRRSQTGQEFMPTYLHKIVAISCCFRWADKVLVKSIGTADSSEKELIEQFFNIFDNYDLQLVSWNGAGFDLPVLQHRGLINGVVARNYWDMGEFNQQAKWNNFINRYQLKHIDLMDILAQYQPKAFAPLDAMAKLCGFPGKMGMDGSKVWDAYRNQQINEIRNYCETDVMNTYLLFLRFQLFRGLIVEEEYLDEIALLESFLTSNPKPHFQEFLAGFRQGS